MAQNNRRKSRQASIRMAFCGVMTALSVSIMLAGGLIPIATYCAPMIAGVFLLPILMEFGEKTAWITFTATALLCLLMGNDKEASFFYIFVGYYPIIKWRIDRGGKNRALRILMKLAVFSASILLMYWMLCYLMNMRAIAAEFEEMGVWLSLLFLAFFDICMLLYDRLLLPLVIIYAKRLRPRLTFFRT